MQTEAINTDRSPEEVTARNKLHQILDPSLQQFGVRFYNIGEYEQMLTTHTTQAEGWPTEVSLYGGMWREDQTLVKSCKDFIEKGSEIGWGDVARDFTRWPHSALQAKFHKEIGALLDQDDDPNRIANYIAEFRSREPYLHYLGILPDAADAPKTTDEARTMLRTIRDTPGRKIWHPRNNDNPYHVGVIFDKAALSLGNSFAERLSKNVIWQTFSKDESHNGNLVLGAISLFDDGELNDKLKELAQSNGQWAHPLFDTHGKVIFPDASIEQVPSEKKLR